MEFFNFSNFEILARNVDATQNMPFGNEIRITPKKFSQRSEFCCILLNFVVFSYMYFDVALNKSLLNFVVFS